MIWTDAVAINKLRKLNFNVFYHVLSYKSAAGLSGLCLVSIWCVNSCIHENSYQLIAYELRASLCRYTFINTDMNQYLIFRKCMGMLINYCKKMIAYQLNALCWASSLAIWAYRAHYIYIVHVIRETTLSGTGFT